MTEKTSPPEIEKPIKECRICDLMLGLGLAAAVCQALPASEQTKCHQVMKPLEETACFHIQITNINLNNI